MIERPKDGRRRTAHRVRAVLVAVFALFASRPAVAQYACSNCIINQATPQVAQFNVSSATIRGALTAGSVNVVNLTVYGTLAAAALSGDGSAITNLSASALASGTVPSARVVGAYGNLTGVGTVTSGKWQGNIVLPAFGGTGANLSGAGAGGLPYFIAGGTMTPLASPGFSGVLMTNGSGTAPFWVSSPTITGQNFSAVPMTALNAGHVPHSIIVDTNSIPNVQGAGVLGNIPGGAAFLTVPLPIGNLAGGTLPTANAASSITATGVKPGVVGSPYYVPQLTIGGDGRVYVSTQLLISLPPTQISTGPLPGGVTITPAQISSGTLSTSVPASSITVTGVVPLTYGGPSVSAQLQIHSDGRIYVAAQFPISISPAQISTGPLPGGVTVDPRQVSSGTFNNNVVASSLTNSGVPPGTYGNPTAAVQLTIGADGRIYAAQTFPLGGISSSTAFINVDNNWPKAQTFRSSVTILNNLAAQAMTGLSGAFTLGITASSGSFTNIAGFGIVTSSGISVASGVYAGFFVGNGAGISGVAAGSVAAGAVTAGQLIPGVLLNAGSLDNGPVASSILPSTVAYTSVANTFVASQTVTAAGGLKVTYGVTAASGSFSGGVTASSGSFTNTAGFGIVTSSGISVASGVYAGFFVGNGAGLTGVSSPWTRSGTFIFPTTLTDFVGIGVNTPSTQLDILGQGGEILLGGTLGTYNGFGLSGSIGAGNYNFLSSAADPNLYINRPAGNNITFRENNVEQMILVSGGQLGIGTTSPHGRIEVSTSGVINDTDSGDIFMTRFSNDQLGSGFIGRKARGTVGSPAQTLAGDRLGVFGGRGFEGDAMAFSTYSTGRFEIIAEEDTGANSRGTYFRWLSVPGGNAQPITTMVLSSTGYLVLGASDPNTAASLAAKLYVSSGNILTDYGVVATTGNFLSNLGIRVSSPLYAFQDGGDAYIQGQEIVGGTMTVKGQASFTNISGFGIVASSGISVASGVYAGFFVGNGAGLTGINTTAFSGGAVPNTTTFASSVTVKSSMSVLGTIYALNTATYSVISSSGIQINGNGLLDLSQASGILWPGGLIITTAPTGVPVPAPTCTGLGGSISTFTMNAHTYCSHQFYTSGTFTIPTTTTSVTVLLVAGAAGAAEGGGGAGGLIYKQYVIGTGTSAVTIGAGGTGAEGGSGTATNGSDSLFGSLDAVGGGNGASSGNNGGNGGSGGGAGANGGGTNTGGTGTASQGNAGGTNGGASGSPYTSGGGGAYGSIGANGVPGTSSGNGGTGGTFNITGVALTFACGGGGSSLDAPGGQTQGTGGCSSAGNGVFGGGQSGAANSGSGAGGAGSGHNGGNGGSGFGAAIYPIQ